MALDQNCSDVVRPLPPVGLTTGVDTDISADAATRAGAGEVTVATLSFDVAAVVFPR